MTKQKGDAQAVQIALDAGANPDRTNWMNLTVLHEACERGHGTVVDLLIRYGADIHKPAADQKTCLHLACEKGHFLVASALVNAGSNIKAKGDFRFYGELTVQTGMAIPLSIVL